MVEHPEAATTTTTDPHNDNDNDDKVYNNLRSSKTIPPVDVGSQQLLILIRHGDRYDFSHPDKWTKTSIRKYDPPLSTLGHRQARETGRFLDSYFTEIGIHAENITLLASPFLRTIQTADNLLAEFITTQGNVAETVNILPESSVWELDGGMWNYHSSLPTSMEERTWYYPRVDNTHQSLFVPTLPESREDFLQRCDQVIQDIHTRYGFVQKSAIIVVTHAAGCIALARSAAGLTLQDINPAPPCGMYILTRSSSDTTLWSLDHHAIPSGANGFVGHVTDLGQATHPWNHFGNKKENNGYTGPPRADE